MARDDCGQNGTSEERGSTAKQPKRPINSSEYFDGENGVVKVLEVTA